MDDFEYTDVILWKGDVRGKERRKLFHLVKS